MTTATITVTFSGGLESLFNAKSMALELSPGVTDLRGLIGQLALSCTNPSLFIAGAR